MDTALTIILVVLVLFGLGFSLFAGRAMRQNSIPHDDGQEILDPKGVDDGMALVVYQPSPNGKIDDYARQIAKELFRQGYKVVLDRPSIDLSTSVAEYDIIVLGSKVYIGQVSELLLDYVASLPSLTHKTLGLFSSGRLETSNEFDEIENLVKGSPRIVTTKFLPYSYATPEELIADFVRDLVS